MQAEGFIDDSTLSLNLRNFYINRNFVNPNAPLSKAEEWTQSFILNFQSGYTPGPIGFGVDALGLLSVKLDGGGGTYGTGLLPVHGAPAIGIRRMTSAAWRSRRRPSCPKPKCVSASGWWYCRSCARTTADRCRRPSRAE